MPFDSLLDEMEQNLGGELRVEDLAEAGFVSRTQLYRAFYNATGHSVKEYIRKRRLSRALALVKHTDMPLLDIAQDCGFGSQQALCKAVKAATGQSPLQYKAGGDEYYFPPGAGRRAYTVAVCAQTIPPTLRLRYYDSRLQGIENRALERLFSERPGYKGRIFGRNGEQKGSKICYELYIESDCADQPAVTGTFAKTTSPNDEAEINAAWNYLYDVWLKTSMFAHTGQPWFEEYIHASGQNERYDSQGKPRTRAAANEGELHPVRINRLALYLPVEKRPGFHKIRLIQCGDMHFLTARRTGANAEEAASRAVMAFLAAHYPSLARTARQFYVSTAAPAGLHLAREKTYTCGIAVQSPLKLPPDCRLEPTQWPAGEYAVLEGDCCGDSGAYQSVLAAWMEGMGLQAAGAPFAIYEAAGGFDTQNIRVKIYCLIKNGTNGQDRDEDS